ncbi:hypothetical protein ACFLTB_04415 [Chloroflexota bacterium]
MQADIDLKEIKKKVYISYFQDGLWDILLGLFLVGWGLMFTLEFTAIMGGIWVGMYFITLALKRWLTYPRAGYIKLAEDRKQQMRMVILGTVTFLLGLAVFFLFSTNNRPDWFDEYFMFMFGVMTALVITMLGYWWQITRWYVYSGLVLAASAAHQWLDIPLSLSFIIPGGLIALYGFTLLIRFLRRYPKPTQEEKDAVSKA